MQELFRRMPSPNEFTGGDGLNTAFIRFTRRQEALDETNGNGDEVNRDQYNLRIDHNFNSKHKVSVIGTHEKTWGSATQAGLRTWPMGFDGLAVKRPYLYTVQFTSTLSNSLLNQVRVFKRASNNWQWGSADRGDAIGAEVRKLLPTSNGIPFSVSTQLFTSRDVISLGGFGRWREGINPMRAIGDDLSWTHGKHAFKGGFEWRRQESNGFNDPSYTPMVFLGAGNNPVAGLDSANYPGLLGNNATRAIQLLTGLTGSVNRTNQAFGVLSAKDTRLQSTPVIPNNRNWNYQTELGTYFKDDWKFSPSLTLNVGIHWEYYGQPYEHDGLAARIIGGEESFYNVKCTGDPGNLSFRSTCSDLVRVQFVGKNSTNPDILTNLRGNDLNNFAPSVGFAWSLPWFGKDKTTIRAGYGMNYEGALRNFITVSSNIGTVPGINLVSGGNGLDFVYNAYTPLAFPRISARSRSWQTASPTSTGGVLPLSSIQVSRPPRCRTWPALTPTGRSWGRTARLSW
jgi:hypothetical protein